MQWRVIGASVTGTSHIERNVPCQDAHLCRELSNGLLLIAVADGAGSAARSAQGAALAVQQAITSMSTILDAAIPSTDEAWRALLAQAVTDARRAIEQLAVQENAALREYATTLLCAILTRTQLVVGQVGDGFAVARADDGSLMAAALPRRGEYANESYFITMDDPTAALDVHVYALAVRAAAFSTDGLLRLALKLPAGEPHAPLFATLFGFIASNTNAPQAQQRLTDFLNSERVCARTDDDKTLVLACRVQDDSAA